MRFSSIAAAAICVVSLFNSARGTSAAETQQISGPVVHENLAIYCPSSNALRQFAA